jgi:superfamily II DNA helicase RecQ
MNIPVIPAIGSGKTMPGLLCSKMFDGARSTVWILPLRSLHEQYHFRCEQYSISCALWSPEMSDAHPPSAVLVAIDSTNWEVFQVFIQKLYTKGRLARIVVDEAHLTLTHADFRPIMGMLKWLGSLGVQIILPSATLPPSLEQDLLDVFGITSCHISRTVTARENISFNVVRSKDTNLDGTISEEYQKAISYSATNRILIFCRSKSDARHTASMLQIPSCDAEMSQEEIDSLLGKFRNGACRAISCTSILGVGLDIPGLTHTIHRDYPADAVSYVQEVGRLGRDKDADKAWSITVLPPRDTRTIEEDRFGARLIRISLDSHDYCRRLLVQMFMDGIAEPCTLMEEKVHFCDVCNVQSRVKPATFDRQVFPSGLMEQCIGRKFGCRLIRVIS